MLKRNSESLAGNSKYEGFCIDLIREVCRNLDVNCQIQPVKDGGYGARKPDGSWSGMIGELVRKVQCSLPAVHTHTQTQTHTHTHTQVYTYYVEYRNNRLEFHLITYQTTSSHKIPTLVIFVQNL